MWNFIQLYPTILLTDPYQSPTSSQITIQAPHIWHRNNISAPLNESRQEHIPITRNNHVKFMG